MRVLIQKCSKGSVTVEHANFYEEIGLGYVIFVGFTSGDNRSVIDAMAKKVANLRIFEDENGVMNRSILDVSGSILSISQFTLYADTEKGNRPSYIRALNAKEAFVLYEEWNEAISNYVPVKTGIFGEDMKVEILNIGPTTIWLEK